jgi:uncharacterized membrane protein YedE/YeeE
MDNSLLIALLIGTLFGFALNKGGLTRYKNIAGAFRFTNMTVLRFMLTAILVAMVGLYSLKGLGLLDFPNIPGTYIAGNVIGGLIFGVGMALAGYCPGTCAAGAGEGKLDYLISGIFGLMTGAFIFGQTYQQVFPQIAKIANMGSITLPDLWGIHPVLLIAIFACAAILLFYLIENGLFRKDKLSE